MFVGFTSCKKERIARQYTYQDNNYHIQGDDTISYVLLPCSINPNGYPPTCFMAKTKNCDAGTYFLSINLKDTLVVFESTNIYEAWYGLSNMGTYPQGQYSPAGMYNYTLQITDNTGYMYDIRDSVYFTY